MQPDLSSLSGILAQAEVSDKLHNVIKDMHLNTWFVTAYANGKQLCHSRAGSLAQANP